MNTFTLKIIALLLMLIDHIGLFFPGTPLALRWVGRISAPLFFFCFAEGIFYTKDRKKHIGLLYLGNLIMMLINIFGYYAFPDCKQIVNLNIFQTLLMSAICIYLFDYIKDKKKNYLAYAYIFIILQSFLIFINIIFKFLGFGTLLKVLNAFIPNIYTCEGSWQFVLLGILFYIFRNSKFTTCIMYICFTILLTFNISCKSLLNGYITEYGMRYFLEITYQWMQIFALPIMLVYNGKRGKSIKYLFYIFYPVHIIILAYIAHLIN